MHRDLAEVGEKSPLYGTTFPEPAATTTEEVAPSFTNNALSTHTVSKAIEDVKGTVIESTSNAANICRS